MSDPADAQGLNPNPNEEEENAPPPEEATSEAVSPEPPAPEQEVPEQRAPEQSSGGQSSPGPVAPDFTSLNEIVPGSGPGLDPIADLVGETEPQEAVGTPPPAEPHQSAWDWTEQYSKPEDRKKEEKEDARGYDAIGDPILSPEETAMAAMYIPETKVKEVHNPDLSYTPRVQTNPLPWKWIFAGILLVLVGMIVAMAVVKVDTGDVGVDGQAIRLNTFQIIWKKLGGEKFATSDPNIMAYLATKSRIYEVQTAAYNYERDDGSFPSSVQKLVDAKLLPKESSLDGWGHAFLINPATRRIVSCGSDGIPDNSDDLVLQQDRFKIPGEFQSYELQQRGF